MNIAIDEGCISCGLCVAACPEVFDFGADELAHVKGQPADQRQREAVQRAEDGCPVSVIHVED